MMIKESTTFSKLGLHEDLHFVCSIFLSSTLSVNLLGPATELKPLFSLQKASKPTLATMGGDNATDFGSLDHWSGPSL